MLSSLAVNASAERIVSEAQKIKKALYIGIVVDEKVYFNSTGGWDGDSIEIDLVADGKEQAVRFRTNAARNSNDGTGTKAYFHRPTAPQTFDAGIIAAVAAVVSLTGYAVSKKQK